MTDQAPLALVTGAGIRLGRAVAEGLAGRGFRLALHYHQHQAQAEELAGNITAARPRGPLPAARCFRADLRDPRGMEALLEEVEVAMGPLDLLVLSAAIYPRDPLDSIQAESFEETLRVNLSSPFLLARAVGLRMKERGRGQIIGLLDWSVERPYVDRLPYTMAKAGLRSGLFGLARALAPEVRVNGLGLGAVLLPEGSSELLREQIRRAAPLQRLGTPADVVQAVLYLWDAEFATGVILPVDGGRSIV
jgi:pteridine reductase